MSEHRLSQLRVGRRLGLAFGAVGALVLVSTGLGLSAVAEQRDIAAELSAGEAVLQEAESARFQIADGSGWQGLVMADVAAFGPAVGLAPEADNRAGMVESKDAVYAWLDGVDTTAMDADEKWPGPSSSPTSEMSRSVQEAAGGTGEIATHITGVSTAAESTTQALGQTRIAVDELSRMAADLRTTVGTFTY